MNLVIWTSPARNTHIFPGVTNGDPGCIQVRTALQELGNIPVCRVTGSEQLCSFQLLRLSPKTKEVGRGKLLKLT